VERSRYFVVAVDVSSRLRTTEDKRKKAGYGLPQASLLTNLYAETFSVSSTTEN
jgi:hypothetical protein